MAVVVTVAAMFMVPAAIARRDGDRWPGGDVGAALDGAVLVALAVMCGWVGWIFFESAF